MPSLMQLSIEAAQMALEQEMPVDTAGGVVNMHVQAAVIYTLHVENHRSNVMNSTEALVTILKDCQAWHFSTLCY
jgi:hypothetical protein